jgi:hypothetical protein
MTMFQIFELGQHRGWQPAVDSFYRRGLSAGTGRALVFTDRETAELLRAHLARCHHATMFEVRAMAAGAPVDGELAWLVAQLRQEIAGYAERPEMSFADFQARRHGAPPIEG